MGTIAEVWSSNYAPMAGQVMMPGGETFAVVILLILFATNLVAASIGLVAALAMNRGSEKRIPKLRALLSILVGTFVEPIFFFVGLVILDWTTSFSPGTSLLWMFVLMCALSAVCGFVLPLLSRKRRRA